MEDASKIFFFMKKIVTAWNFRWQIGTRTRTGASENVHRRHFKTDISFQTIDTFWVIGCVAQLAEWSIPAQRSAVRIQSSANFTILPIYCQLYIKDENKEKRPGMAH